MSVVIVAPLAVAKVLKDEEVIWRKSELRDKERTRFVVILSIVDVIEVAISVAVRDLYKIKVIYKKKCRETYNISIKNYLS